MNSSVTEPGQPSPACPASPCGRFAPSPTGALHFGSLVAALGSWLFARAAGGRWLVRIEDLDRERTVAGADRAILATLAACGLESDAPPLYQSQREEAYAAALASLRAAARLRPCWCSRSELEASGGIHPHECLAPARERPPAWRLRVGAARIAFDDAIQGARQQDLAREVGDFVLWRADGGAAYQLAVVVDDAAQGITQVVRGADLLDSTPRQILLQRLLGLPQPGYAHLPLALGDDGRKLSKQDAARPVDPREPLPALRRALAFLGQRVPAAGTTAALLAAALAGFDPRLIPRVGDALPPGRRTPAAPLPP